MKEKIKILIAIIFLRLSSLVYAEQGTAILIKEVTPIPGTEVAALTMFGDDIVACVGNVALKINKELELESKSEMLKTESPITAIAFYKNQAAVATIGGTMRYERDYLSNTYQKTNIHFGYQADVKSMAFSPYGDYLFACETTGLNQIYLNEDRQNNQGVGNLIGNISDEKIFQIRNFNEKAMVLRLKDKLVQYDFDWNILGYMNLKQTAKAEKKPQLLQQTEKILLKKKSEFVIISPSKKYLYYITKTRKKNNLYRYDLFEQKSKLLFSSSKDITCVNTIDDLFIYLAIEDKIIKILDEHSYINVKNDSDVTINIIINDNFEVKLNPQASTQIVKAPGLYSVSAGSYDFDIIFDNYDGKPLNLKKTNKVSLIARKHFALQIVPIKENLLKVNEAAISDDSNIYVFSVTNNTEKNTYLLALDANTHKLIYELSFPEGILIKVNEKHLFVAAKDNIFSYNVMTGILEKTWTTKTGENIKFITTYGEKVLGISSNTVIFISDINSDEFLILPEDNGVNLTACFIDTNKFVLAKNIETDVYEYNGEKISLYQRIPASWIVGGEPKNITSVGNGAFALVTEKYFLIYNGDPNQIEQPSMSFQINNLEFLFSYMEGETVVFRFLNRWLKYIENFNLIMQKISEKSVYQINQKIESAYGRNKNKILCKTENSFYLYSNSSDKLIGQYYFVKEGSVFITPGNTRENQKYFPCSENFDPFRNLRIIQEKERDFTSQDKEITFGG